MRPAPTTVPVQRSLLLVLLLSLAACAGPAGLPSRAALEARVADDPDNIEALRDLGALLALEGDYGPALGALDRALQLDPTDGQTLYMAGLTNEALGQTPEAENAYARYLTVPADDAYRDSLRSRLDGLVRARLRTEFADALATEDSLMQAPRPGTVGVLPFAYRGENEEYVALGRGLAEVLAIDLAAVEALTVVERARLQSLLAEYDLARAGVLDPATAPRAGRLLGAGRLIGGEVDVQGEALRIESAVWADTLQAIETTEGTVADLFRIQKGITVDVLDALGIPVDESARARVMEPPTLDLVAFLLYSRALLEEDDGDFVRAGELYDQALQRDPSFALAARRRAESQLSAASARPAAATLVAVATGSLPVTEGLDIVQFRANALQETLGAHLATGDENRDPGVEGSRAGILGTLPDPPPPPGGNTP